MIHLNTGMFVFQTPGSRDELNFSDGSMSAFDEIGISQRSAVPKKPDVPLDLSVGEGGANNLV